MIQLTDEQQNILHDFLAWYDLKINAFAWSGKSSTLWELIQHVPQKKILVLTFNRSIKDELRKKFPSNSDVFTTHSFVLKYLKNRVKRKYISNNKNIIGNIIDMFHLKYEDAYLLCHLFTVYAHSDIRSLDFRYLMKAFNNNEEIKILFWQTKLTFVEIITYLLRIYSCIEQNDFPMTHEFYVKYFQLNIKDFLHHIHYDVVMLDEAQDTNEVTIDIFKQLSWQKVVVWDDHQSIYGWRNAIWAMDTFDYPRHYLSYSFRVNQDTAHKADFVLNHYKHENNIFKSFFPLWWKINWNSCIITRTNVKIIYTVWNLDPNDTLLLVRSVDDVFQTALHIWKIKAYYDSFDRSYLSTIPSYLTKIIVIKATWDDFCLYVNDNLHDRELSSACNLVVKIPIYSAYKKCQDMLRRSTDTSRFIATAHTIKGMEYDSVILEDDFPNISELISSSLIKDKKLSFDDIKKLFLYHQWHPLMRPIIEEINLMYVSMTRAIKNLDIRSSAINELLSMNTDDFLHHIKTMP